jgi:hypothetical protein
MEPGTRRISDDRLGLAREASRFSRRAHMARSSQTIQAESVRMILNNSGLKWASMILVGSAGWAWMNTTGLHLGAEYLRGSCFIAALIPIALVYCYTNRDQRIMELAHFGAQYLSLLVLLDLLTCLAVSTQAPLVDRQLVMIDKAMGFDWVA